MIRRRSMLKAFGLGALALLAAIAMPLAPAGAKTKFVFANASPYDNLDPHMILDVGRVASRINMYDGLLRWLDNPAKIEPWLAESYTISPDGKIYTFKLRKGAKFHDGTEIKASDVVYSMERILAAGGQSAPLFAPLIKPGTTKAPDDYTVEFHLAQPSAIFLAIVPEVHVLNTALVKKNEKDGDWGKVWLSKNEAGSGSYALRRYDPAIGFTAERFKDHWNKSWGPKPIDEIEFRTVIELNSRVLGLLKGDFHGTDGYLPQDQIKRLRDSKDIYIGEAESTRIFYAIIHNGREPMNDINFRKALSYAFDYDGFNKNILSDSVARNPVPLPNNIWGAPKGVKGYTYDLDKAKEYLAKMDKPPREINIAWMQGYQQTEQSAALFQAGLNKIGIKTKIVSDPWSVVSTRMRDKEQMYDILFLWKSTYYADPNNWVGEMYACNQIGQRNNSWYCNPEVDKLLMEALETTDQEVRRKNYEKASTMVMEDAGGIFVYNTKWFGPFNKKVTGVRFCPIGDGQEMRWASMEN